MECTDIHEEKRYAAAKQDEIAYYLYNSHWMFVSTPELKVVNTRLLTSRCDECGFVWIWFFYYCKCSEEVSS